MTGFASGESLQHVLYQSTRGRCHSFRAPGNGGVAGWSINDWHELDAWAVVQPDHGRSSETQPNPSGDERRLCFVGSRLSGDLGWTANTCTGGEPVFSPLAGRFWCNDDRLVEKLLNAQFGSACQRMRTGEARYPGLFRDDRHLHV